MDNSRTWEAEERCKQAPQQADPPYLQAHTWRVGCYLHIVLHRLQRCF